MIQYTLKYLNTKIYHSLGSKFINKNRIHDQELTHKIVNGIVDPITGEYFEESKESLMSKFFNLSKNDENNDDNINVIESFKEEVIRNTKKLNPKDENIEEIKAYISFEEKKVDARNTNNIMPSNDFSSVFTPNIIKPKSYLRKSSEVDFAEHTSINSNLILI
jgi:hypothetical protein